MEMERINERFTKEQLEEFHNLFNKEDVIEGVPAKSIQEIIAEVAEEEGMTEEEVADAVEKMMKMRMELKPKKRHTKKKVDKSKKAKAKKQAKASKKRNR